MAGDEIEIEEMSEDRERLKVEEINQRNIALLRFILKFSAQHKEGFRLSDLIGELKNQAELYRQLMEGDLIFHTLLKLYDFGPLRIREWQKETHEVVANPTGELDLDFCLMAIAYNDPDLFGMASLQLIKPDEAMVKEEIRFSQGEECFGKSIQISDFFFVVEVK